MTAEISKLDSRKHNIVYNLFVDSADQNYLVARWCYQQGLAIDFLWNAAHCLEKFLKAALLLNGQSSIRPAARGKTYGHDLVALYDEVLKIASDLLPDLLVKPNEISSRWRVETAKDFIRRISDEGDAHNRYQIFGYVLAKEDLYKLDRMVFAIRRLCCPLHKYGFGNIRQGQPSLTFRDLLKKSDTYMPHRAGSRWQKLTAKRSSEEVRYIALNHNFMFAPDDFSHGELRQRSSALSPVLGRQILTPEERGVSGRDAVETAELVDWTTQNIFLPPGVKAQLQDAAKNLRQRTKK